ncbi:caspase family protein [Streptomyces fulvoviolaceus]|uniref:caspase family protein n=1 Tax=Streptomyces fulvoviolaceus TaxID=285535 RepID=UPI0021C0B008|nr:caspase family protein [Streptomyces fulvoviolaceus]MCT9081541.1 caspase family protein [Streptomyces fulvoviolaceus]
MSEPRRFLIATAVSHYPHAPEWDRPGLVEARRKMVELFTGKLGYEHVSDLGANPTQHQLLWELREFCRSADRRPDDIVAVYIAGHGERLDNEEYVLLTSDTNPDDLYDALQPGQLARKILAGTKVRRLLLMLDTCYSGQGGNEVLASMAKLKSNWREKDAGLALITSAQPNELAQTGTFPDLLSEAVTSLATAGYTPQLLSLDAVVNATRANPKRPDFQHIGLEIIGLTGEIPPFLPNAKHSPRLSHTDMALQQAAEWDEQDERRDVEFRTRLLRRAMGHSDANRVGWWFSGRHRALGDITGWLRELPCERPTLVVTAGPGSGKTAVLGLLAAVSDPEYRRTVPLSSLGLHAGQLPPPKAIGTAVYAQNLTDQQVVRALAAGLRLPPAEAVADLLNHLNSRPEPERPDVILIDGLDEAATPTTLCGQVLRPLMELAGSHLRLLLGTRPHLLDPLGLNRRDHIDLDAPHYADPRAVLAYAVRNLIDAHPESPYLDCPHQHRLAVAQAVAEAADHSFLVARITAGTLAATRLLPDPWNPAWRRSLPSAAADAMHHDLHQRFGESAVRILDLLRPLAYAEGQGLPWEDIWAPLASELSGQRYTNEDLHQLRRDAGAYVVEAVEDGRSVYRLYHEAMAEYLRQGRDAEAAHRAFTNALRRALPYLVDGTRDWGRAHPYALRHLATHAAAAGMLDSLLADLEYLVHADCDTLAPHLLKAESDTARLHAAVYVISLQIHRGLDVKSRRRLLAVNAARFNEPSVLEALNGPAPEGTWKPLAATGAQVSANVRHVLAGHTGSVNAVACTEVNGHPVAVSASRDQTLRIWDLTTGQPVGTPMTGHTGELFALACTNVDGRPVAVSGSDDSTVRIWDLTTGRSVREPLTGHVGRVDHLACTELDGRPVVVSGSDDSTFRIWDLNTGRPVGNPVEDVTNLNAMACTVVEGRPVVVTGSFGPRLAVWDLRTQSPLGHWQGDEEFWFTALTCTEWNGHPVAVGYSSTGKGFLWDLRTCRLLTTWQEPSGVPNEVVCTELNGRGVAITGCRDATVRISDLADHQQVGPLLKGHSAAVGAVACSSLSGQLIVVTGSFDNSVRVWDLSPRQTIGRPVTAHTSHVTDLDLAMVNGRPVFVTISNDGTVRLWDRATGQPLGPPMAGHDATGGLLACTVLGNRPVAVSTSFDDKVKVWDVETGRPLYAPHELPYMTVTGVAATVLNGRPIALAACGSGMLLAWDIETGEDLYVPLNESDDLMYGVSCTALDGRPVAVATSREGLRVWDLATGRPVGVGMPGGRGSVACTVLEDRPVVVNLRDDRTMQIWDLRTGQPVGRPMSGHTKHVNALVCAHLDGRPVAVTGSWDNTVRIWDLQTSSHVDTIHVPGPCDAVALDETGLLICSFGADVGIFRRS